VVECARLSPDLAVFIDESPSSSLSDPSPDLFIRFDSSTEETSDAIPLTEEDIAVIIHADNPVSEISMENLQAMFSGRISNWAELQGPHQGIEVWSLPAESDSHMVFDSALELEGTLPGSVFIAPGPVEMLEAVSTDPGAVGYLPRAWLNSNVKNLELDPDLQQRLTRPILAFLKIQPGGALRTFTACLQSGAGRDILLEVYSK
jgi:hypothetical protein